MEWPVGSHVAARGERSNAEDGFSASRSTFAGKQELSDELDDFRSELVSAAYERLRAFVLGSGGDGEGLVAFLRGGVPGWVRARASVVSVTGPTSDPVLPRETGSEPERTEFVRLMANIICHQLSEEAA
jgi:hypothetical protein